MRRSWLVVITILLLSPLASFGDQIKSWEGFDSPVAPSLWKEQIIYSFWGVVRAGQFECHRKIAGCLD